MSNDGSSRFPQSRLTRFLKVGSLTTKVGASYLGQKVRAAVVSRESAAASLVRANVRNAERMARTMGELKGAIMKVGQMLSLQADVLPKEITDILSGLQQDAPAVSFSSIRRQVEEQLGRPVEACFAEFHTEPHSSASIGQVHRAVTRDGRKVVVKIQYPGVDRTIESDFKNLKVLFRALGQVRPKENVESLFQELRQRLVEELDYELEARNLREFRELFAGERRVIIPEPVEELSAKAVLTMEYVGGWRADDLCAPGVSQHRRDYFGSLMGELIMRQFFELRMLHADPNLANFAFTPDDRLVMYDFGCVKRFPDAFVKSYAAVVRAALDGCFGRIGDDLRTLGFYDPEGTVIEQSIIKEFGDVLLPPWTSERPYDWGKSDIHNELSMLALRYWKTFLSYVVPPDIIFFDRVLVGMYGNLRKLGAATLWPSLLRRYLPS
ncbi:MAG: AarF/ABC1/UbiB kinase family protein [Candidatus Schekmanbacteria bacterium]|nr:AarF/ABC1/UbiB kinase family protein [Candidatus Schekmanbacteria bacterium]